MEWKYWLIKLPECEKEREREESVIVACKVGEYDE